MQCLLITIGLFLFGLIGIAVVTILFILMAIIDHVRFGVHLIRTPDWVLNWLSHNLDLQDGIQLYDLGCGDGAVLKYLKQAYPHIKMTGIEGAFLPLIRAKWKTRKSDILIVHNDFYTADISKADVVFCFLTKNLMARLERHLKRTLKKGAEVYSYAYSFPTWKPTREIPHPSDPEKSSIFVYTRD